LHNQNGQHGNATEFRDGIVAGALQFGSIPVLITIDLCAFLMLSDSDKLNKVNNTSRLCSSLRRLSSDPSIALELAAGFQKNVMKLHSSEDILLQFVAAPSGRHACRMQQAFLPRG
jgi:hypothetical protein